MNVMELLRLDGRVAIVTGGRGLYGSAIAEGLCEAGATVVIASRNGAKCEEYAATLRDKGYNACGMALDLNDDASIAALVSQVVDKYGRLDILVNNAVDRSNMVSFPGATREKLQASVSTNLNGQILLSQKVVAVSYTHLARWARPVHFLCFGIPCLAFRAGCAPHRMEDGLAEATPEGTFARSQNGQNFKNKIVYLYE